MAYITYLSVGFLAYLQDNSNINHPKPAATIAPIKTVYRKQFMYGGILAMLFVVVRAFTDQLMT